MYIQVRWWIAYVKIQAWTHAPPTLCNLKNTQERRLRIHVWHSFFLCNESYQLLLHGMVIFTFSNILYCELCTNQGLYSQGFEIYQYTFHTTSMGFGKATQGWKIAAGFIELLNRPDKKINMQSQNTAQQFFWTHVEQHNQGPTMQQLNLSRPLRFDPVVQACLKT